MQKQKKNHQGIAVPKWLSVSLQAIERLSPHTSMLVASCVFSKPIKFKIPFREQKALKACTQNTHYIAEIDRHVATYEWGNTGDKILLVHGWSGRGMQLHSIAESLHQLGYHVVAFDAPAHGKSTGKKTNVLQMIATIRYFDKTLGGIYGLVGHSLGGMAIFNYCKAPNSIKKVVTVGAGDLMGAIFENFIAAVGLRHSTCDLMTRHFETKFQIKAHDFSSSVVVKEQHIPTLVLHDEDDKDIAASCADNIIKHHKNATLIKTKGLGHRRILRDDVVLKHINTFIKSS